MVAESRANHKDKSKTRSSFLNIYKFFEAVAKSFYKIYKNFLYLYNILPNKNLKKRIISAIILIPLAIFAIFYSDSVFSLLLILIAIVMSFEWQEITRPALNKKKWQIIGIFYILLPLYAVLIIRNQNPKVLFWMFTIIWATDIMAFFVGKTFGGAKLAPRISPNKTWSGAFGGIVASLAIGVISAMFFAGSLWFFMASSVLISIFEQIGDLTESQIKRNFGVKDSGSIIPGHGGVLDRLDGIIFAAPLTLLLTLYSPESFL